MENELSARRPRGSGFLTGVLLICLPATSLAGQVESGGQDLGREAPPQEETMKRAALGSVLGLVGGYGVGVVYCETQACAQSGSSAASGSRMVFSVIGGVLGAARGAAGAPGETRSTGKFLIPAVIGGVAATGAGVAAVLLLEDRAAVPLQFVAWTAVFSLVEGWVTAILS